MDRFRELLLRFADFQDLNVERCPWVKVKGPHTFIKGVKEEADELSRAIENNDLDNIIEETGDVFWDAFTLLYIISRDYGVDKAEILTRALEKMKNRKPYLFNEKDIDVETALKIWYKQKKKEKKC